MLANILTHLQRGDCPDSKWPDAKSEYWALCPFHQDTTSGSFSVSARGFKCFACGASGGLHELAAKLGVRQVQLGPRLHGCSDSEGGYKQDIPFSDHPLQEYAQAKGLDMELLRSLGLSEGHYKGEYRLALPYYDEGGKQIARRYRVKLQGKGGFRWASGSSAVPYGLWRLEDAREAGYVLLVEGESDCHTLWQHNLPALGIPGANNWKADWASYVGGLTVYLWREPDQGGDGFSQSVGQSLPEVRIITAPQGRKDPNECHLLGDDLPALLQTLMAEARPYRDMQTESTNAEATQAKQQAKALLESPDILAEFDRLMEQLGLVGEGRNARLLYLALTSRLLDKPVSVAVKGPSSGGKSFTTETVLKAFPESAYLDFTSMSPHALIYDDRPIDHRFIVLYEASGLGQDRPGEPSPLAYMLRSLLSEGSVKYTTVEKGEDGLQPRHIERAGPTGLITTTTWASLHAENETRLLSITVRDDPAQTGAIFQALADRANGQGTTEPDLAPWHALQRWLELAGGRQVTIPYAHELAAKANPRAVRLRRDFGKVLSLIQTHAILHQASRERDTRGCIVATLADYRAVYDLVIDTVNEGVEASVSPTVRETVQAADGLCEEYDRPVTVTEIAGSLGLDKSSAWRRVRVAMERGYLVNQEEKRGKPARLTLGEPLPDEAPVLPSAEELEKVLCLTPPETTATVQPLREAAMGDLVYLLDADGNIAYPQPVTITDLAEYPDGSIYALTDASSTGWPLEQCELVQEVASGEPV